jgi:Pyridoxamine 5'-phosphate oxidase
VNLPAGLIALLHQPSPCFVTTLMPDGSPQMTQTWADTDGEHVVINTVQGFQKVKNVERDPRVAVSVSDPSSPRCGRGPGAAGRGADRAQQREPEQLRVVLAPLYGHEGNQAILARPAGPRVQQGRLPAAGGRRDDRHPLPGRTAQRSDQVVTVDQPLPGRDRRPPSRGPPAGHRAISSGHPASVTQVDHQDPVTTSHLPDGEPGHAQEPTRFVHDRKEKSMTSLFGVVSTEVAA